MIKNIGIELPENVYEVLKRQNTMAFLGTYSDKGTPSIALVNTLYPKNKESILVSMFESQPAYTNMVWQKKVMLTIVDSQNIVCNILGRAGIVRAPSRVHPLVRVVQIDVIDIINDPSMLVNIDAGVKWSHSVPDAETLHNVLMKELQECAKGV